jgi:hypothetical protein
MESDFEKAYRQAAENRMQNESLIADEAYEEGLRQESARILAEPAIEDFAYQARLLLKREGVWCKEFWPLPFAGSVKFTLDRVRSRLLRPVWKVESGPMFLCLTKDGVVMNQYNATLPKNPDRLYENLMTGGDDYPENLRQSLTSDWGLQPSLWLNTDTEELFVIHGSGSYSLSVQPFVEWGARAVDAVVTGWRSRQS